MNFPFNIPQFQNQEEAALYFNPCYINYNYNPESQFGPNSFIPSSFGMPVFYSQHHFNEILKNQEAQRPTQDKDPFPQIVDYKDLKVQENKKNDQRQVEQKLQEQKNIPITQNIEIIVSKRNLQKEKSLKKNAESNVVHNTFSYICSELKSHTPLNKMVKNNTEKLKIFYIFANNLKKLNAGYINRKTLEIICRICPKGPHAKMLAKSIKRLQILPISQLRGLLRKLIFHFLRGPCSLTSLLTSSKLSKCCMLDLLNKRRVLTQFMKLLTQVDQS